MEDPEILTKVMKHLGYSIKGEQSKFARTLPKPGESDKYYSQDSISKILNGNLEISKEIAKAINEKHHISLKFLLTGKGNIKEEIDQEIDFKIKELEDRCKRYEEIIDNFTKSTNSQNLDEILKNLENKLKILLDEKDNQE